MFRATISLSLGYRPRNFKRSALAAPPKNTLQRNWRAYRPTNYFRFRVRYVGLKLLSDLTDHTTTLRDVNNGSNKLLCHDAAIRQVFTTFLCYLLQILFYFISRVRRACVCALSRSTTSWASLETACVACGGPTSPGDRLSSITGRRTCAGSTPRIVVNVSGLRFETHFATIERFHKTLLGDPTRRDR